MTGNCRTISPSSSSWRAIIRVPFNNSKPPERGCLIGHPFAWGSVPPCSAPAALTTPSGCSASWRPFTPNPKRSKPESRLSRAEVRLRRTGLCQPCFIHDVVFAPRLAAWQSGQCHGLARNGCGSMPQSGPASGSTAGTAALARSCCASGMWPPARYFRMPSYRGVQTPRGCFA